MEQIKYHIYTIKLSFAVFGHPVLPKPSSFSSLICTFNHPFDQVIRKRSPSAGTIRPQKQTPTSFRLGKLKWQNHQSQTMRKRISIFEKPNSLHVGIQGSKLVCVKSETARIRDSKHDTPALAVGTPIILPRGLYC